MACGNDNTHQSSEEMGTNLPGIEKVELNLVQLFEGFTKVLQEYGITELAVVEFRLDKIAQLEQALAVEAKLRTNTMARNAQAGVCRCPCGSTPCFKICPC